MCCQRRCFWGSVDSIWICRSTHACLNLKGFYLHDSNLRLFQWIAAGFDPHPALLIPASIIATGGPWLCLTVISWVAWRQPHQRGFLIGVLFAAGVTSMISHWIAASLHMPRPFMMGLSPTYVAHGGSGSMPSTHAAVMFTVSLLFLLRAGLRKPGIAIFAIAAFTGWARIYIGMHFPADIAAGLMLACGLTGVFMLLRWPFVHLWKKMPFSANPNFKNVLCIRSNVRQTPVIIPMIKAKPTKVILAVLTFASVFFISFNFRSDEEARVMDWQGSPAQIPQIRCVEGFKFHVLSSGKMRTMLDNIGNRIPCDPWLNLENYKIGCGSHLRNCSQRFCPFSFDN